MIDPIFYQALLAAPGMAVVANRIYPTGALGHGGVPAQPSRPYVMYNAGEFTPVRSTQDTRTTEVGYYEWWVYDNPGSFVRIKQIHVVIQETFKGLTGRENAGTRLTSVEFWGRGRDQYDPVKAENTIRATYRVVASR